MQAQGIKSIKKLGIQKTLDFKVNHPDHNFYAEGIVVSNSHSAAYGYLLATCTYFKANYTKEFFLSLLKYPPENGDKKETHVLKIKRELDLFGIKLLPPSLIKGNRDFIIEDNKNIRFGLEGVKGLAESALKKIENFKPQNCNKFEMFQASKQAGLSCGVMASLISAGALDEFLTDSRSKLSFECLLFSKLKDKEKIYCIKQSKNSHEDLIELVKSISEWADNTGKRISRKTRLNTLRKDTEKYAEIYKNNRDNEELCNLIYERQNLGYSYSSTLKDIFSKNGRTDIINLKEFNDLEPNETGVVVCHVTDIITSVSKKGNNVMKVFVEDETDSRYFYFAGQSYKDFLVECDNKPDLKEGDIIAIKLSKSKDSSMGFIQRLKRQGVKIFTKLAEVKDIIESNQENKENLLEPIKEINNQTELSLG